MGGSESKERQDKTPSVFTSEEKKKIHKFYAENNLSKDGIKIVLDKIGDPAASNLSHYVGTLKTDGHHKGDNSITVGQFEIFLGYTLKGYATEKSHIFKALCTRNDPVTSQELFSTTKLLLSAFNKLVLRDPLWNNWSLHKQTAVSESRFVLHLLQEILLKESTPIVDEHGELSLSEAGHKYTESDTEDWMSKSPLFMYIFDAVFNGLFHLDSQDEKIQEKIASLVSIPYTDPIQNKPVGTILDINDITFINFHLLKDLRHEWRLVFSNSLYGDSFTQLLSRILNKGPTLLVIQDKSGHKFGGFCSKSWELYPKFFGTSDCFLFSLTQYGIYHTTHYNENYMYLNHGQQTLPNGLGMGGQFDYFGLWIDNSFNHGHSKAKPTCTTYGSPQLSATPEFEVDMIEVWALGPLPKKGDSDDEHETDTKKSILHKDPEAKAMLELMGKEQASEGFREMDEDVLSDEMKKKMNTIPKLL